ncbi:MAG: DNA polymerase I, partial [Kiritimatiellaeota bacterium]|nr:DNA polymerase I [Kiritimatiellota bacterium]
MQRLVAIDVMPLLYRGHFALISSPRMTSRGENVSALVGFVNALAQVLREPGVTHLALAFDSRTPTFRSDIFPDYKATRNKAHEDIVAAVPMVEELAAALRVPALRVDGFEADDVLGTLARLGADAGMEVWLMTPDKDAAQLL